VGGCEPSQLTPLAGSDLIADATVTWSTRATPTQWAALEAVMHLEIG